jgi:AcrR family transcriptional regulator
MEVPTRRWTAEERREAVIEAAIAEFAASGLAGASTEAIAKRAGISHAYLFRLFGTKRDLFVAALRWSYRRVRDAFAASEAARKPGEPVIPTWGAAYKQLLDDEDYLRFQYAGYAACGDPVIREAVREEFMTNFAWVREHLPAGEDMARLFMATGLLMTLGQAIGDPDLSPDGSWSARVLGEEMP